MQSTLHLVEITILSLAAAAAVDPNSADDPEPHECARVPHGVHLGVRRGLELLELGHGDVVAVQHAHGTLVAVAVAVVRRAEDGHHLKLRQGR